MRSLDCVIRTSLCISPFGECTVQSTSLFVWLATGPPARNEPCYILLEGLRDFARFCFINEPVLINGRCLRSSLDRKSIPRAASSGVGGSIKLCTSKFVSTHGKLNFLVINKKKIRNLFNIFKFVHFVNFIKLILLHHLCTSTVFISK